MSTSLSPLTSKQTVGEGPSSLTRAGVCGGQVTVTRKWASCTCAVATATGDCTGKRQAREEGWRLEVGGAGSRTRDLQLGL